MAFERFLASGDGDDLSRIEQATGMVLCPLAPCGLPELNARAIHLLNPPLMDPTRGRPCIGGNAWEDVAAIAIDCPHARRMQQRGLHLWLFEKPMPTGNACLRS